MFKNLAAEFFPKASENSLLPICLEQPIATNPATDLFTFRDFKFIFFLIRTSFVKFEFYLNLV